jgi:CelD/BcsL family acetyltransferase involved in cellulose biosynthesis
MYTRHLSEAQFAAFREQWQALLTRSDADPLFMSWDWQWLWWTHHGASLRGTLRLLAVYSPDDRLLGLAPLYEHRVHVRGIPLRRLELIGQAWHGAQVFFSEYLDFIVDRSESIAVSNCIHEALRALEWDELAALAVLPASHVARVMGESLAAFATIRPGPSATSYRVPLSAGFPAFLDALPASVRRKLANQRQRLANVVIRRAQLVDLDELLATLARFKRLRWGERYTDAAALRAFERELALRLLEHDRLELTALESEGRVIGVMYNARVGETEYYLQSSFDPNAGPGLSIGLLHFGYAIEAAAKNGVRRFDLLAGEGLNTDYKRRFAPQAIQLVSWQAIRTPWLRALYTVYDRWFCSGSQT